MRLPTLVHVDVVIAGYSRMAGVLSGTGGRVKVHGGLQDNSDALLRHCTYCLECYFCGLLMQTQRICRCCS